MNHSSGGSATTPTLESSATKLSLNEGATVFAAAAASAATPPALGASSNATLSATSEIHVSGSWSAYNVSGGTVYISGATTISASSGLSLYFDNSSLLYIYSGAVVSGVVLSGGYPKVYVSNGGVFENSYELNGYVYVYSGGVSISNFQNSAEVHIYSGGSSIDDIYVNSGAGTDWDAYIYVDSGAVISGITLSDGAVAGLNLYLSSGASITDITVASGATISAYDKTQLTNIIVGSGGNVSAGASATLDNITVSSGATLSTGSSATFAEVTISSGATLSIAGNADLSGVTTYSGSIISTTISGNVGSGSTISVPSRSGAQVISGGTWSAVNVSGATYYESGSATIAASGAVILSGVSTLYIQSGAVVSGATISGGNPYVYVQGGGVLTDSYFTNGYLYVSSGGLTSANALNSEVTNISSGGSSVDDYYYNSGDNADGWGTVTVSGGATVVSPYIGSQATGAFAMYVYSGADVIKPTTITGGGSIIFQGGSLEICFLAGTLIATPSGSVAVEDLNVGDEILTFDRVSNQFRPDKIKWTGSQRVVVHGDLPDDLMGYPVCIRAGAIAENIPSKDLRVTPEHCFYIDGRFVPARMLVNDRSIIYDHELTSYTYYHFETEKHAIISSDGMLSETYLDTGNRGIARSSGNVIPLSSTKKTWENDAAAPLDVSRKFVEPIYQRLVKRADALGFEGSSAPKVLTSDPNLRLLSDQNGVICGEEKEDGSVTFLIPQGIRAIRIMSRSSRPCDTIGAFVDDRRTLGVLIGDIVLSASGERRIYNDHLTNSTLGGWETVGAASHCRWTTGAAEFRLPDGFSSGVELTLFLLGGGPYLKESRAMEDSFALAVG